MTYEVDRAVVTGGAFDGRGQDARAVAQRRRRRSGHVFERNVVTGIAKTPLEANAHVIEVVVARKPTEPENARNEIDAVRGSAHRQTENGSQLSETKLR